MEYRDDESRDESLFEAIAEGDEDRCRTLWLGAILQAVLDAKGKFGNGVIRSQARLWLEGRGTFEISFATACSLAGVDFERTRKRCQELLEADSASIDFRAMKKDLPHNRTVKNRKRYFRRAKKNEELRRKRDRIQVESFLFGEKLEENFPDYTNDNLPEASNDNFSNQPKEKTDE